MDEFLLSLLSLLDLLKVLYCSLLIESMLDDETTLSCERPVIGTVVQDAIDILNSNANTERLIMGPV
jgi:hypothetical protein